MILGSRLYEDVCPAVAVDHVQSMDLALEHLIALGHREIGFMYAGEQFYGTQDMSLIGFDNIFLTDLTTPTLSAVGYDYDAMAQVIFDTAVTAIEGREHQNTRIPPFRRWSFPAPKAANGAAKPRNMSMP